MSTSATESKFKRKSCSAQSGTPTKRQKVAGLEDELQVKVAVNKEPAPSAAAKKKKGKPNTEKKGKKEKTKTPKESDSTPEPKALKKQTKKVTDPNAPQKPQSAFFFFCAEAKPGLKHANPTLKPAEIMALVRTQWKEMSKEDKKPWEDLKIKDKQRFEEETALGKSKPPAAERMAIEE